MGLYTATELKKKTVGDLKDLIEQHNLDVDEDAKKPDLIEALLEVPESTDDEVEDDEEEDDAPATSDEEEDDDEVELPDEDEVEEEDEVEIKPAAKATAKKTKYTEGGKTENGEKLLGAKEVATAIGTEAKTLRQFFRSGKSTFTAVGAGGRYEFKESDIEQIKSEFDAWKANKPGRGASTGDGTTKRTRGRGKAAVTAELIEEVEEIEELEELDDLDGDIEEEDLELED